MTGPEKSRRVYLIGFMGAGKTSVGKVLAQRLGRKFYDLDEVIAIREQQSIAAIFETAGEASFRRVENAALRNLLETQTGPEMVLALGGGAFVQAENRGLLRQHQGVSVLLDAPVEELARRCEAAGPARPLAQDRRRFEALYAERQSAYNLADLRVQTAGKTIEEVAGEIEKLLAVERARLEELRVTRKSEKQ